MKIRPRGSEIEKMRRLAIKAELTVEKKLFDKDKQWGNTAILKNPVLAKKP